MNDWHVGTRGYQAPEILLRKKEYDLKVDVFAMGVVLFILLGGYPPFEHARDSDKWYQFIVHKKYKNFWKSHRNCGLRQQETDLITRMLCYDPEKRISISKIKKHQWFTNDKELLCNSDLIKVLRYRHQRMEQQRNSDPNKQKILQHSMKRPLVKQILTAIEKAGKTEKDLPPKLPQDEIVNPYDVYTTMPAYDVLQGLEASVTQKLKATLSRPDYNQIDVNEREEDENANDDDDFDGTYIDVVNFSLVFGAALQDLEKFDSADKVYVHIGVYFDEIAECNLVKFTRLSGEREAFKKIIETLSVAAGIYLTGLDKKSAKIVEQNTAKDKDADFESLYKKCFPDKVNGGKTEEEQQQIENED